MKSIKRIIALLLTAVMTMTMSVTAFAVDSGCSLTVNVKGGQNLKEQTISLYKLFGVTESGKAPNKNYAYTVNTQYKAALASVLKINETSKDEEFAAAVTNLGNDNDTKVQNFANDFTAKALTSNLAVTATSGKITEENKTSYEFTDLDAGYYLVYVTGGKEIQSSLVTVDESTKTVNLKTEAPSITKTANKPSVNIGDVVTYTVKGSVPDTTGYDKYVYTIHDELSNGLDFVKNAKGDALDKANEVNVTVAFKDATDASTAPTTAKLDAENNRKMSLDLSAWVRANQVNNKGKEFTVTYYAKVNKDAVVTEKNSATLEYGNDPDNTTTTKPSEAQTPTYPLDIKKFKTGSDEKLAGAKFRLYSSEVDAKANDESKAIKVSPVVAGNYVVDPASTTTEFESVKSIEGKGYNLHVNGLAAGTYYLVETEAPAGYNKLTAPIKVTITKTGDTEWTISKDGTEETDEIIDVENSTGSMLPSTGGMGTIAFTVVAALLVLGVAVSFIRDRKREN